MKRHKTRIIPLLALLALATALSVAAGLATGVVVEPYTAPAAHASGVAVAQGRSTADQAEAEPVARPVVTMSADMAVLYTSVDQLTKAADLVVRGEVTRVSYVDFNTSVHTIVTFRVSRCLKGDVAEGDEITIAEVGGVTSMATINGDKFGRPTEPDAKTMVRVQLEGAPLTEAGEECLYFLDRGSIGVVPGVYYVPLGAFQGRFKIEDAVAERFVPVDWQDGKYTALRMGEGDIDQTVLRAESK
jgi:hypothetical protein